MSRFHETIVRLGSPFPKSRLKAIGPVSDAMNDDGIEQLVVELPSLRCSAIALVGNQGLERLKRLQSTLKADRARLDGILYSGLGDDRSKKVVGEDVRPDFFANQIWSLTSQDVHLHRRLD